MPEMLEIYDLSGNQIGIQSRESFYREIWDEYKTTGKITRQVRVVRFLLMTTEGMIYVQKRSRHKSENPGKIDKTVGGHVPAGYTDRIAAGIECGQELRIPMMLVTDKELQALRQSQADLSIQGIMQRIERVKGLLSQRVDVDGNHMLQPVIATHYVGYYDGSIRFQDGECSGVETFTLAELQNLMKDKPEEFTTDLVQMIHRLKRYLVPFDEYKRG